MSNVLDAEIPTVLAPDSTNAIGRMLGLLGDEWNLLIIQQALLGANRYSQFMARLPISNSVLTNRLALLVREGLLARREHASTRARTEYLITPRSRSLWPALLSIWEWERNWVAEHREALPSMQHQTCGQPFAPAVALQQLSRGRQHRQRDTEPRAERHLGALGTGRGDATPVGLGHRQSARPVCSRRR